MSENSPIRLSGRAKFLVDFGPLLVFFIAYFFGDKLTALFSKMTGQVIIVTAGEEMFLAVAAFLPAFAIAFIYSVWKERRVAPMLFVSGVAVGGLGGLTLVLHNKSFFFMKPTIVYSLFALGLAGGVATGRNALKTLFDGALTMPDGAWRVLTIRYIWFFAALAIANEIAWRWLTRDCNLAGGAECAGEATWINLKVFGFTAVNLVFAAAQAPFLAKHMQQPAGDNAE